MYRVLYNSNENSTGITFYLFSLFTMYDMVCEKNNRMNSQFSIFAHTLFIKSLVLLPSEAAALGEPEIMTASTFLSFTLLTNVSHLALPPVGWHRTVEHPAQTTTVWAWLKTVVILRREYL